VVVYLLVELKMDRLVSEVEELEQHRLYWQAQLQQLLG
jgi:FtsZ-binding cell division protein ZapB